MIRRPLGVVAAGGPGSRIGGGKPQRTIAGRRLIDIAVEKLTTVCPQVMIVTVDVVGLADLPVDVVADRWPGQGPLNALATAFLDSDADSVLLLAVDLPLMNLELLRFLAKGHDTKWAIVPTTPGGLEPLCAWYSRKCLAQAVGLLEKGERRIRRVLSQKRTFFLDHGQVAALDPGGYGFLNVNLPEDLQRAREIAAHRGLFDTPIG